MKTYDLDSLIERLQELREEIGHNCYVDCLGIRPEVDWQDLFEKKMVDFFNVNDVTIVRSPSADPMMQERVSIDAFPVKKID